MKVAGRIVANVNLDMPVFLTASTDIVAFGAENSTLDEVVRKAVADVGYTLSPDPMPEENIFVRSDRSSFVKRGVPAVYLVPGFTAEDPAVNGQQVFGGFLASHYHRPSDDLSLPMDLQGRRALHARQPRRSCRPLRTIRWTRPGSRETFSGRCSRAPTDGGA